MRSLLLLPAAIAAVALTGCSIGDDGPRRTQTRDVASFTRVDSDSSVEVRLHVGEPRRVRVRAGEKVIDDVATEVRDGTLHVTFDHDGWGGNDVVVEASVPKLDGIDVSGSGDIEADGIDADSFTVRSEGSADIVLTGSTAALDVEVEGSGNADLADLRAQAARVKVRGSGDADVRADERLDVDVDGSGNVRYHGDPELNQRVDGSGDLSRADS
ncbi:MAG TPA: head GIN domain-containing protein [Solirubrobacteraceae bacterium]|nr:head GIN domain-containing protein [Solirubrobacteraceae bacterium]